MSKELNFVKGVSRLHALYTEHVRILAHAYEISDEEAALLLDRFGYHNVAREILRPPKVDLLNPDTLGDPGAAR